MQTREKMLNVAGSWHSVGRYVRALGGERTNRFCMYLSLMFSHEDMQLEMYKWTNSVGKSTAVVSRFTTSIE